MVRQLTAFVFLCVLAGSAAAAQTPPLTDAKVSRGGMDLYYRIGGSGQPVVILSGGPGMDCDYMLPLARHLAASTRAILVELRGTGRSRPKLISHDTVNLALNLEDLEALRNQLGLERWTVAGHSAGGLMAMYYAAAHPAHVDKLILLDTAAIAAEFMDAMGDNIRMRLSAGDLAHPSMRAQLAAYFFDPSVGKKVAEEYDSRHYVHTDVNGLLGVELTPPGYDLRPALMDFDRPVLVLAGRQDPIDPRAQYETHLAFRNSTIRFVNRAGHFPWTEQPQAFFQAIDPF